MSASTVSATAIPRRRTSTVNDVKQSIDIVNDSTLDNTTTTAAATASNADDKLPPPAAANKDLSHSIRGEAVLERSTKETTTTTASKKPSSQAPSSGARTRSRKPPSSTAAKHAKPRWKTVVSVVGKNFLLVLVLTVLVQMVRKLAVKDELGGSMLGFSDMEGRISAVETSMKTTAKMLQVQVEVVDQKIDSEVRNLRGEIVRRVEDKGVEIEGKLNELGAKSEVLEAEIGGLREGSKGFVSKEDVIRMYDELSKGKEGNVEGSEASFDVIRGLAREVVEKEIEKHAADGLGRVDYALASGGSRIVKHSEPLMVGKAIWFASPRQGVHENAVKMLTPSFGEPGMCFALKGSSGFVQIRLRTAIVPEAITLEHVAKSVAYDQSSAPKSCRVFGWLQGQQGIDADLNVDSEKVLLSEFTYDLEKSNAQTSNVIDSASSTVIDTVRFEFSSNHGSETHTCIYRLRVHGHSSDPVPMIA